MDVILLSCREYGETIEERVDVAKGRLQIECFCERSRRQSSHDSLVGLEERSEIELLVPRPESGSLHETVRLVPRNADADEREENALAEHEAMRGLQVAPHAASIHDEPVDQPREAVEHVVEGQKRIRKND